MNKVGHLRSTLPQGFFGSPNDSVDRYRLKLSKQTTVEHFLKVELDVVKILQRVKPKNLLGCYIHWFIFSKCFILVRAMVYLEPIL